MLFKKKLEEHNLASWSTTNMDKIQNKVKYGKIDPKFYEELAQL
jgi:hypothetical protein